MEDTALAVAETAKVKKPNLGQMFPYRCDYGTAGTSINLRTNYFHIAMSPTAKIYKYKAAIETLEGSAVDKGKQCNLDEPVASGKVPKGADKGKKASPQGKQSKNVGKEITNTVTEALDNIAEPPPHDNSNESKQTPDDEMKRPVEDNDSGKPNDKDTQGSVVEAKGPDPDNTKIEHDTLGDGLLRKRRRLFELLIEAPFFAEVNGAVATDYASIILTTTKLPEDRNEIVLTHFSKGDDPTTSKAKPLKALVEYDKEIKLKELQDHLDKPHETKSTINKEEVLQALNIILKQEPNLKPDTFSSSDGSKFYSTGKPGEPLDALPWVVAYRGFYASVRSSTSRLLANVNVSTSAFYKEGFVHEIIKDFKSGGVLPAAAARFLKNRRVSTSYCGYKKFKIIRGFARNPNFKPLSGLKEFLNADEAKFHHEDKPYTVAKWFAERYTPLKHPELPVLDLGKLVLPTGQDQGTQSNEQQQVSSSIAGTSSAVPASTTQDDAEPAPRLWVPAEFCYLLPGQAYGKTMTGKETDDMLEIAQRRPAQNANRIVDAAKKIFDFVDGTSHPEHGKTRLERFGLTASPSLIVIPGRQLTHPRIVYKATAQLGTPEVKEAKWNMRDFSFHDPKNLTLWSYLRITADDAPSEFTSAELTPKHIAEFMNRLRNAGLKVDNPISVDGKSPGGPSIHLPSTNEDNYRAEVDKKVESALESATQAKPTPVKFLLVLLPHNDAYLYSTIKEIAEMEKGIHTVCSLINNFAPLPKDSSGVQPKTKQALQPSVNSLLNASYIGNLASKFNLKLGGTNHTTKVDMMERILKNTMVIGIDVNHPAQGAIKGAKSIAGVVANTGDQDFGQWPCSLRTQEGKTEIIREHLKDMIKERIRRWTDKKNPPARLLVYRDGVSEGQYQQVLDHELHQIQEAYNECIHPKSPKAADPKIALVVVAKR